MHWSSSIIFAFVYYYLVLECVILVSGQELSIGRCPTVYPMENFEISNYSGLWYEVERYVFVPQTRSSCVQILVTDNEDDTFTVFISQFIKRLNGVDYDKWENAGITRFQSKTNASANFTLDLIFQQAPLPFVVSYSYIILHTDYDSYTIMYACKQFGLHNLQSMWILSRAKTLSPQTKRIVYEKIINSGLSTEKLTMSDFTACSDKSTLQKVSNGSEKVV